MLKATVFVLVLVCNGNGGLGCKPMATAVPTIQFPSEIACMRYADRWLTHFGPLSAGLGLRCKPS